MYKLGDKVETPLGVGILSDISANNETKYKVMYGSRSTWYAHDEIKPYRTAHEKLIELGWEDKGYVSDARRYEGYNMWVIFNVTNKTYTINKLVGIAIICPNIDITLSRILTQYLEELEK